MNIVSLLFAFAAFVIFLVAAFRGDAVSQEGRPRARVFLVALGLAVLTAAWMAQLLIETAEPIRIVNAG